MDESDAFWKANAGGPSALPRVRTCAVLTTCLLRIMLLVSRLARVPLFTRFRIQVFVAGEAVIKALLESYLDNILFVVSLFNSGPVPL